MKKILLLLLTLLLAGGEMFSMQSRLRLGFYKFVERGIASGPFLALAGAVSIADGVYSAGKEFAPESYPKDADPLVRTLVHGQLKGLGFENPDKVAVLRGNPAMVDQYASFARTIIIPQHEHDCLRDFSTCSGSRKLLEIQKAVVDKVQDRGNNLPADLNKSQQSSFLESLAIIQHECGHVCNQDIKSYTLLCLGLAYGVHPLGRLASKNIFKLSQASSFANAVKHGMLKFSIGYGLTKMQSRYNEQRADDGVIEKGAARNFLIRHYEMYPDNQKYKLWLDFDHPHVLTRIARTEELMNMPQEERYAAVLRRRAAAKLAQEARENS